MYHDAINNALLALRRYSPGPAPNMQSKFFSVRHTLLPVACAVIGTVALSTNANATYTVIEDDLYPTSAAVARDRLAESGTTERFKIIFNRGSSAVGPNARLYIDDQIERLQAADEIRIIGRPDSATATNNKQQRSLGLARASALRAYLVRSGIPASSIQVELDSSGNPMASSGVSPAEVVITTLRDSRSFFADQARVQQERAIPRTYRYLNQDPETRPTPAAPVSVSVQAQQPSGRSSSDASLIQYLNQAVQTGQMPPTVAAQILRSLAAEAGAGTSQQVQVQAAPAASYAATRWVLDAKLTLKDNIDQWAKSSNWRAIVWEASNLYQVTATTTLDGAFPDVLKKIADSTGLNICVITREKQIRVTDANVPCGK